MLGKRHLLLVWLWLGALALAMSAAFNGATTAAQETIVRLETPTDEVKLEGSPFKVNVLVDNVVNLGGFQFSLEFDPTVLKAIAVEDGPFLGSSGREVICGGEEVAEASVSLVCVTLAAPVSLGGVPGADDAGVLATVEFSAAGEGETSLGLRNVKLVQAEVDEAGTPITIPTASEDGMVTVTGGDGFAWVLWGPVIAGVVLVVSAGAASFWWFRLRHPGAGSAAALE